jgi:hypothetical protein
VVGGTNEALVRVPKVGCPETEFVVTEVVLEYGVDMVNGTAVLFVSFVIGDGRVMVAVVTAEVVVTVRV